MKRRWEGGRKILVTKQAGEIQRRGSLFYTATKVSNKKIPFNEWLAKIFLIKIINFERDHVFFAIVTRAESSLSIY